jgi:hypothetical protein
MRVPTASALSIAIVALTGVAYGRAPAQEENKPKAKATDSAADQAAPTDQAAESTEVLVAADTTAWQTLTQDLFTSGESSVADPGRIEPLARHILKLGPVELLPKFDQDLVYDDNVFLTERQTERDFISRTRLGIVGDYAFGGGQHHISAGYDMLRNVFLGGDAKDFVEQLASAQLDLSFQHLKITVGDRYEDRTDPILAVFTAKVERVINTPHALVGWHEDTWYMDVSAQDVTTRYDDPSFQQYDRSEGLASFEVGRLAREDVWTFARVDATDRTFDNAGLNDGHGVDLLVGARVRRGEELDSMVSIGVLSEHFDDTVPTDADNSALNVIGEGRVRWWVTRSSALDARILRTSEFSPVSNYEIDNRVELGWMQQIDSRLSARGGVGVEYVNPSSPDDTFTRYTVGAGLRYALLANADLTLNWRLRLRSTSAANGDYTDNQFSLGFSIRL